MWKGYPRTDTDAFLKTLDNAYRSMPSNQKKVNGQIIKMDSVLSLRPEKAFGEIDEV